VAEIALRLAAYQSHFFTGYDWKWNVFALFLISTQVLEEIAGSVMGGSMLKSSSLVLRTSRLIRCTRVLRMFRMMRLSPELTLLISCIVNSGRAFMWSMALLLAMTYAASAGYTNIVLVERLDGTTWSPEVLDELMKWYGSVPRSLLSLLQAITGGVDWNDICEPLFQ